MKYGHRRDAQGYGDALMQFDAQLRNLIEIIDDDTVIILTADHGCDPEFIGTDHTREYVPLLVYGSKVQCNQTEQVSTYQSFADLGAAIAQYFGVNYTGAGTSFAEIVFSD